MKRPFTYLLQGFLYIAPLGATLYVVFKVFTIIDAPLRRVEEMILRTHIPGLGAITVLALLTLLGWLGSTIIARPFKAFTRRFFERAPLLGAIEGAVRDLLSALFAKERRFQQPVLVRVNPVSDLEKVGFITQKDLSELGLREKVAVYFPHSYNFSGELFIVPRELVRPLDIPAQEAMKFIVSGGLIHIGDRRSATRSREGK
jgi:uncharacterized membrane protein